MNIPIKNIYYLILYAFDKVKNKDIIKDKDFENTSTVSDVIITLFLEEVSRIIKSGLFRNYSDVKEQSMFIRGKIDLIESLRSNTVSKVVVHDEFSPDNSLNKILKYTMNKIIMSNTEKRIRNKAKRLYYYFNEVPFVQYSNDLYKQVLLNKMNNNYDFALKLSVFINRKIIPSDQTGNMKFLDILEDYETMSSIYEHFLRNFYRIHTNYKITAHEYKWFLKPLEDSDIKLLPNMRTDIEVIIDDKTKIIIDAKFYKNAFSNRYDNEKLLSNNMYQMNAYLMHNLDYQDLRGILLYPSVNYNIKQKYKSDLGFNLEFRTIDLSKDWIDIHTNLLNIIKGI